MHSIEQNITGPEMAPDTQPLDKSRLSAAVDLILNQSNRTALPPDLTRPVLELSLPGRTPQPLGIPWLDTMLGGGLSPGEVFLFLATTGGGKTTLSTQIAWLRAMQRSHTIYVTYDEPFEGYIESRFCSLMTGTRLPELRERGLTNMSPEIQRKFQAWREAYGSFLHVYDASGAGQGEGGIEDIRLIIADETDQGRHPGLIIVDWLQCAVLKGMGPDRGSAREVAADMDDYAERFAAICRNQRIQGILMQQLAADYQGARNVRLDHKMAAACSTLGNHCQHAVVLGRLTPDGEGLAISSKGVTPSADRPPQLVRLNGAFNRFEIPDRIPYDEQAGQLLARCKTLSPARANQNTAGHGDRR